MIGLTPPLESLVGITMLLLAAVYFVGGRLSWWRSNLRSKRVGDIVQAAEVLDLVERTKSPVARNHLIAAMTSLLEESDEADL